MAQQRYSILEKLDAGGMAEVWKGKATSLQGFEKLVAIKRVLPHLAKNEKFITMFLDEARLSLFLNHANVVQTFDIGRSGDSYFIVMEYVQGSNLKNILECLAARGDCVPVELAAFVGIEVCRGLNHAHQRRDPQGRPLGIVHRDISPPNVLLSAEGEVKLVDFGLAKAATQVALTDPGVVKGKFSYLSPEAAYGDQVDFRADIFATGILLWEMLANRRLFLGVSDLETIKLVRKAEIPPLTKINRAVHPELDRIVRKALARKPEQRHASTVELAEDLARYLFGNSLMVTSFDIGRLVESTLAVKELDRTIDEPRDDDLAEAEATIQTEIGRFASLEDLARWKFKAVSESGEASVETASSNEDPRGWLAEMGLGGDDEEAWDEDDSEATQIAEGPFLDDSIDGTPIGNSASGESGIARGPQPAPAPSEVPTPLRKPTSKSKRTAEAAASSPSAAANADAQPDDEEGTGVAVMKGIALGLLLVSALGGIAWAVLF